MNRRELLAGTSAALAGLSIPGWAEVFGPGAAAPKKTERVTILRAAFDAARLRGRPLLVLVGDQPRHSDRARRWANFLDHGTRNDVAELALCELVCSVREDLQREFPLALGELPASVMAILIETDTDEFALIPSSDAVPPLAGIQFMSGPEGEEQRIADQNLAVQRALHARIAPDRETLERRVAAARKVLTPEALLELGSGLGSDAKSFEAHARFVPALLSLRALDDPASAPKCVTALANKVLLRWRVERPPGARWGRRGNGCITDSLEGLPPWDAEGGGPCGTGFVPNYARRFLWFYTERERGLFEDAPKR